MHDWLQRTPGTDGTTIRLTSSKAAGNTFTLSQQEDELLECYFHHVRAEAIKGLTSGQGRFFVDCGGNPLTNLYSDLQRLTKKYLPQEPGAAVDETPSTSPGASLPTPPVSLGKQWDRFLEAFPVSLHSAPPSQAMGRQVTQPTEEAVQRALTKEGWANNTRSVQGVVGGWVAPRDTPTSSQSLICSISEQSWRGLAVRDFGGLKGKGVVATCPMDKGDVVCDSHGTLMKRPNLKVKRFALTFPDGPRQVLVFLALQSIKVGEELFWDYDVTRASFGGEGPCLKGSRLDRNLNSHTELSSAAKTKLQLMLATLGRLRATHPSVAMVTRLDLDQAEGIGSLQRHRKPPQTSEAGPSSPSFRSTKFPDHVAVLNILLEDFKELQEGPEPAPKLINNIQSKLHRIRQFVGWMSHGKTDLGKLEFLGDLDILRGWVKSLRTNNMSLTTTLHYLKNVRQFVVFIQETAPPSSRLSKRDLTRVVRELKASIKSWMRPVVLHQMRVKGKKDATMHSIKELQECRRLALRHTTLDQSNLFGYVTPYLASLYGHRLGVFLNMTDEQVSQAVYGPEGNDYLIKVEDHKTNESFGTAKLLLSYQEYSWNLTKYVKRAWSDMQLRGEATFTSLRSAVATFARDRHGEDSQERKTMVRLMCHDTATSDKFYTMDLTMEQARRGAGVAEEEEDEEEEENKEVLKSKIEKLEAMLQGRNDEIESLKQYNRTMLIKYKNLQQSVNRTRQEWLALLSSRAAPPQTSQVGASSMGTSQVIALRQLAFPDHVTVLNDILEEFRKLQAGPRPSPKLLNNVQDKAL
ncbi:hypothetical protein JOQ06_022221 [Pogonophryne albipinna]|uniref:SET domain-containing protein n=1 Tax=Pogonophryne albipinna TaxID=1090488 RepID=A0AAD6A737_9TELE|nr:hypothetical protein JOQ06_022221 [Pogonophryne albipinna]